MKLSDINPHIRFAENLILDPVPFRVYSYDHRLLYVRHGELRLYYGDAVHDAAVGTLLMWQSGTPYRFELVSEAEIILLNFDFTQSNRDKTHTLSVVHERDFSPERLLETDLLEDCSSLLPLLILDNMRYLEDELMSIVRELGEHKLYFREAASARLKAILCDAARQTLSDAGTTNTVERVIAYIRENYARPITNRDISDSVNYHEYYVNKLIRAQTGLTLHRYLTACRVQNAEKLLATTEYPVSKIAELCGFATAAYFISAFRQQTGKSPLEYRKARMRLL